MPNMKQARVLASGAVDDTIYRRQLFFRWVILLLDQELALT